MDLKIKDLVELLNVSETTIRRWLADGKIPAYRINQQYRFNPTEIEDWVMNRKLGKQEEAEIDAEEKPEGISAGNKQFSLYRAVHRGGIYYNVPGKTKEEIIKASMMLVAKTHQLDADILTELLVERENLAPTALNNGVGVPHTRDFLLSNHQNIVTIVFPETPIHYGALDGNPVHTLFFLFACDEKQHLHLLAKIAHLTSKEEALKTLKQRPEKLKLLESIKTWEQSIPLKNSEK